MKKVYILLIINFIISQNNFIVKNINLESSTYEFNLGTFEISEENNYNKIEVNSKGNTQLAGYPELPTYSFNYLHRRDNLYLFGQT